MGNFAIMRVQKVKTISSLAARGRHNFREQDTPNADGERLDLNVVEGAKSTDELLKAVSDLLPTKRRKDAVIGLEYLITASPEHFGEDWREAQNHGKKYFADAIAWLEAKHGKGNVVCATVHLDESTPHLAAFVVPLVNGKLNAKAFTGGAKVLAQMQTDFAEKVGFKYGLERGVERSQAVHQDNAKIKPMVIERLSLMKQVKVLSAEVERLTKSVSGSSDALAVAQAQTAKAQERLTHVNQLMLKDMQEMLDTKKELAQAKIELAEANSKLTVSNLANEDLAAQLEGFKRALEAPVVPVEADVSPEALEAERGALMDEWKPIREASKGDIANGRVVAAAGGIAIVHIGMGKHAYCAVPPGIAPVVGLKLDGQRQGLVREVGGRG